MIWIPVTLAAATFQILRTSRQHELRTVLDTSAAGFVRYAYGFPLAVVGLVAVLAFGPNGLPTLPARFWVFVTLAGLAQIIGTVALLTSFKLRDFAIGTVYAKTEVVQVAIVSTVLLDEPIGAWAWIGVVLCLVGVVWLAAPGRVGDVAARLGDPAAWMGAVAGGLFAVAAVGIRGASNALDADLPASFRALVTLTVMLGIQSAVNGAQLAITQRSHLLDAARAWRRALPVGILSLLGSFSWAWAMTLTSAAKVRTLGQVELVIAFVISAWWLGERHERNDYLASALVLIGIGVVVALA